MIIKYALTSLNIEKNKEPLGQIETKHRTKITDISEQKTLSKNNQKTLKFEFSFNVLYEPGIASIKLDGFILFLANEMDSKSILEKWNNSKAIDEKFATPIINFIMSKCNIKTLSLTQDFNLPPHIPIPRLEIKKKQTAKAS